MTEPNVNRSSVAPRIPHEIAGFRFTPRTADPCVDAHSFAESTCLANAEMSDDAPDDESLAT